MEKTKITHIEDGFDFLGFNVRQYKKQSANKLLIKPSKDNIKKAKKKIKDVFDELKGQPVKVVINILNPIIRGYANYWKHAVSKKVFSHIDNYIWKKVQKHPRRLHPKKSWKWITNKYFKKPIDGIRNDKWILTCPKTNKQLLKMAWTKIERHTMVKFKNSPNDPLLSDYWERRKRKKLIMLLNIGRNQQGDTVFG